MLHIDLTLPIELILFLLFLWILNLVFYRPLAAIFRERNARLEAGLRAAEQSQSRAEETQREVRRLLDQARAEAQGVIAAANKEAGTQRQSLMAEARSEADVLLQQAQAEIQRERQAAVEDLRRAVAPLAVLAASQAVGSSLDSEASRQVADRTISEAGGVQ